MRGAKKAAKDFLRAAGLSPSEIHLEKGWWDCPSSPDAICWYNERMDPSWDSCVFCGEPHERK